MEKIELNTEVLKFFLRVGGHVIFDRSAPKFRTNIESFSLSDKELVITTGKVEINECVSSTTPRWKEIKKEENKLKELKIDLAVFSEFSKDRSGIYLTKKDKTEFYKIVDVRF